MTHPMPKALRPVLLLAALASAGCVDDDPCGEYVDYMCTCHPDEVDCADLQATYAGAGADLQDECAIALDDQQAADDDAGWTCGGDTGTYDTGA